MKKIAKFSIFTLILGVLISPLISFAFLTVSTEPATEIASTSSKLNASFVLSNIGGEENKDDYDFRFYFRKSGDAESTEVSSTIDNFQGYFMSSTIKYLLPSTTYEYYIKAFTSGHADDDDFLVTKGSPESFTTKSMVIKDVDAISSNSARVEVKLDSFVPNFRLDLYENENNQLTFKDGSSMSGEMTIDTSGGTGFHVFEDLEPNTKYIVKATSNGQILYGTNDGYQFETTTPQATHYTLTLNITGDHPGGNLIQATSRNTGREGQNIGNGCSVPSNGSCSIEIPVYELVTLTYTLAPDATFVEWTGCTTLDSDGTCKFQMTSDKTITAEFHQTSVLTNPCTSFSYSSWSSCSNGTKTRTIATRIPAGCVGGVVPELSRTCSSGGGGVGDAGNLIPCGTEYEDDDNGGKKVSTPCKFEHIFALINNIIKFIFRNLVIPIAAIMFAYAGILLLTSGGEASKKTKAKKIFFNVALGIIIAAGAFLIVKTILVILGYQQSGWDWFGF